MLNSPLASILIWTLYILVFIASDFIIDSNSAIIKISLLFLNGLCSVFFGVPNKSIQIVIFKMFVNTCKAVGSIGSIMLWLHQSYQITCATI